MRGIIKNSIDILGGLGNPKKRKGESKTGTFIDEKLEIVKS